jgi:membrane associated rhomboid family serine protease
MFGAVLENLWGPKRFLTFYFLCGIGAALLHLTFLWFDYSELLNDFYAVKEHVNSTQMLLFLKQYANEYGPLFYQTGGEQIVYALESNPSNPIVLEKSLEYITTLTSVKINTPTLGASGAVFGVLAAFVYLFPNTYIYLYFLFPIKAKWLGLAYFGIELVSAIQNSAGDNVARWAHIGGGIVGFLLVLTWNKKNRRRFY